MDSVGLSSAHIISQPLPDLLVLKGYHTKSDSRHDKKYAMKLARWESFARDVKGVVENAITKEGHLDAAPTNAKSNPCCIRREQCLCGDELSLSGRFTQNALVPATSVAQFHGVRTRFGDFKTSHEAKENRKAFVPDYVAVECKDNNDASNLFGTERHRMRVVGEAKTSWAHDLKGYYDEYSNGQAENFRHALGQVALYMHQYKMMYGFLTTYRHTVFLMQEWRKGSNEPVLYHSEPIAQHDCPKNGQVSVRQCLFYLLYITRRDDPSKYTFTNPIKETVWVIGKKSRYEDATATPHNQTRTPTTSNQGQQATGKLPNVGNLSLKSNSRLQLRRDGEIYRGEIQLAREQIRDIDGYEPHILIDGHKIPVYIERDVGRSDPAIGSIFREPSASPSRRPPVPSQSQTEREALRPPDFGIGRPGARSQGRREQSSSPSRMAPTPSYAGQGESRGKSPDRGRSQPGDGGRSASRPPTSSSAGQRESRGKSPERGEPQVGAGRGTSSGAQQGGPTQGGGGRRLRSDTKKDKSQSFFRSKKK